MRMSSQIRWHYAIFTLGIFALTLTPESYFFIKIEQFLDKFISNYFPFNVKTINEQLFGIGLPQILLSKNEGLSKEYIILPLRKFFILILFFYSIINLSKTDIIKEIFDKKNIPLSIGIFMGMILLSPPFQAPYGVASMGQGFMAMSADPLSVTHAWYQYKILIPLLANMSGMYGPGYYFFWLLCLWITILLILTPFKKEQLHNNFSDKYTFIIILGILSSPGFSEYLFTPGYVDVLIFGILFYSINKKISNSQQNSFAAIGFLTHELSMILFPIYSLARNNYFPLIISIFFFVIILANDPLGTVTNRVGNDILNDVLNTNILLQLADTFLGLIFSFSVFIIFIPGFLLWCLKNNDPRLGYALMATFIAPIILTVYFIDYTRIMLFSIIPIFYYIYFNSQYGKKFLVLVSLIQIFTPNFHFKKDSVPVLQNGVVEWAWNVIFNLIHV